jgi:hypothetical protein
MKSFDVYLEAWFWCHYEIGLDLIFKISSLVIRQDTILKFQF